MQQDVLRWVLTTFLDSRAHTLSDKAMIRQNCASIETFRATCGYAYNRAFRKVALAAAGGRTAGGRRGGGGGSGAEAGAPPATTTTTDGDPADVNGRWAGAAGRSTCSGGAASPGLAS
jgi:hypothetical protein